MTSFDRLRAGSRRTEIHALEQPPVVTVASQTTATAKPLETQVSGIPDTGVPAPGVPLACIPKSPPKIRAASIAQDGHSLGEQRLYDALFRAAHQRNDECRIITIGYRQMSDISGLTVNNCKANINALAVKLSVDVAGEATHTHGRTYLVYSYGAILQRRKSAGLTHYIKSKGVAFVDPSSGAKLEQGRPVSGIPEIEKGRPEGGTPFSQKGIPVSGGLPYISKKTRETGPSAPGESWETGAELIARLEADGRK